VSQFPEAEGLTGSAVYLPVYLEMGFKVFVGALVLSLVNQGISDVSPDASPFFKIVNRNSYSA